MKISKLFHWLYCILMLFPFFGAVGIGLVWTFNTGSEVPTVPEKVDREIDFNQLIYNGNFYGTNYWTDVNSNSSVVIPGIQVNISCRNLSDPSADTFFRISQSGTNVYLESGHILYMKFKLMSSYNIDAVYVDYTETYVSFDTSYGFKSFTFSYTDDSLLSIAIGAIGTLNDSSQFSIGYVQLFDLTQMFGEGEEPSTEEFDTLFPNDYYNTTRSTRMVLENYDTIYVPDNWTNYIWLPSFGGMGATIKSVFTYLIQTMFGISVATGTGGYIVLELLTYWLCISLIWLCFDVIMYVPLLIHRMLDKGVIS